MRLARFPFVELVCSYLLGPMSFRLLAVLSHVCAPVPALRRLVHLRIPSTPARAALCTAPRCGSDLLLEAFLFFGAGGSLS